MMTKRKTGSIRFKIWAAIMGTAITLIAALWLLQVVFLDDYYLSQKEKAIHTDAKAVVALLENEMIQDAVDEIYRVAVEKTLCVDISGANGREMLTCEGLGDNCFLHLTESNRLAVFEETIENRGKFVQIDIKHPKYDTRYNTCSILVDTEQNGEIIITLTATLAPIIEATAIIQKQLILVSIGLCILATIIAFLLSRSITKPIKKITKAARTIALGELNVDVSVKSNDEIGELSQTFLYMTHEIAKVNALQKELVANISHDIRTPLTVIKGYAETIKDITGEDKETREKQLDIIVEETNRLNVLVSDALDLSLLQAGRIPLNCTEFDVVAKLSNILARFDLFEQTKGFKFKLVNLIASPTVVIADEVRIEQVVYNLIYNAINHIGDKKEITVTIDNMDNDVRVSISDTGVGIENEDLPLIWDRYYKPYKKIEGKAMGTGLGLAIVKAIFINHGVRFGVFSTINVGSTFWFTLSKVNFN